MTTATKIIYVCLNTHRFTAWGKAIMSAKKTSSLLHVLYIIINDNMFCVLYLQRSSGWQDIFLHDLHLHFFLSVSHARHANANEFSSVKVSCWWSVHHDWFVFKSIVFNNYKCFKINNKKAIFSSCFSKYGVQ